MPVLYVPRAIIFLAVALSLLVSCGKKEVTKEEAFNPEAYLARADQKINNKEYEEARKILLEVKNRDTAKKYAPLAQLKIAESYVRDDEPDSGIQEYRKFLELYPDNQYAYYAQYQIAMAYFNQIESPDRGSGAAQNALKEFVILKERYPRNPYREIIELRIKKCRDTIAEGEFMVAHFYYKKESYSAAVKRFEGLLKQFPDFKRRDEALLLLGKSYKALKMNDKASDTLKTLTEHYPSSKFTAEARKALR